jgi:tripartite-type tricarboxylate transporter receptor subunit TctC
VIVRQFICCGIGMLLAAAPLVSTAQTYPNRPVRLIAPFPPGGSVDIVSRLVGQKLTESLGQQFVVDNRPGAGSNLGIDIAAKAQPDGYTLVLVSVAFAINSSLYKKLPYDAVRDFVPVALVASAPNLLVTNPALPASSVRDLVTLAKKTSGSLNYASAGSGTPTHLAAELFNSMTGAGLVHIPYKGGGPAFVDVISGQVKVMFPGIVSAIGHVKNGRLKALGVTSLARSKAAPDVAPIAESGYPGYEAVNWYAVLAPAKTSSAIVNKLNSEIVKLLQTQDVQEKLVRDGADAIISTPKESADHVLREIEKWRKVVTQSGASAQ